MSETVRPANPFPGIRPFREEESDLFFGREGQSDELLRRLRQTRFLAVVGTSGSGKSSLVKAGLLPALYSGFMTRAGSSWQVATFRPGGDPIGNLARALNDPEVLGSDGEDALIQGAFTEMILRRSGLGLVQTVREARLPADHNLLVVADQFEELFRFKQNAGPGQTDEAAAFVKLLLEATHQDEVPVYVVLTMRSDFLGDCAQFQGLAEAINDGQYLIPRMKRDERRAAITGPVAVGGGRMAPRLLHRLLNDVGDDPDHLPILQHALSRTWDYWAVHHSADEPIDLHHYDAVGGMEESLSNHAEEAYAELEDDGLQEVAANLFKALTEKEGDNRGIRRPTRLDQLAAVAAVDQAEAIGVIEAFRRSDRSFLMPPAGEPLKAETTVDISHESLMRNWGRLVRWVDEEAESARFYGRLSEDAALHRDGQRALWRDPELHLGVNWRQQHRPNAAWARRQGGDFERDMGFLDDSVAARQAEIAAREREQQRKLRRNRIIAAVSVVVGLCMLGLMILAIQERDKADVATLEARKQEEAALAAKEIADISRQQAVAAADSATAARQRAEEARVEAVREKKKADTARVEAVREKKKAEEAEGAAVREKEKADAAKIRADEKAREAQRAQAEADTLKFQAVARQMAVQAPLAKDDTLGVLLARQAHLFYTRYGGPDQAPFLYTALHQTLTRLEEQRLIDISGQARALAFSPDGRLLVTADEGGLSQIWDLGLDAQLKRSFQFRDIQGRLDVLAVGPRGRTLAVGGPNALQIWDLLRDWDPSPLISAHLQTVQALAYSPAGDALIVAGEEGRPLIATGEGQVQHFAMDTLVVAGPGGTEELAMVVDSTRSLVQYPPGASAVALGPQGRRLTAAYERELWLWDLVQPQAPPILLGAGAVGSFRSLAFSPDGAYLAAGDTDGDVYLWHLLESAAPGQRLSGHQGSVLALAFSPDSRLLATGSGDHKVRLWHLGDLTEPTLLEGHQGWVLALAFSPDGRLLVSGGADRTARFWNTQARALADRVCGLVQRSLSPAQWIHYVGPDSPYVPTCGDWPPDRAAVPYSPSGHLAQE